MDDSTEQPLPPFRIRQLLEANPGDTSSAPRPLPSIKAQKQDGIISIRRSSYENLVKTQPDAALNYVDDDDGELITVGSGFELDQRLQEPLPIATAPDIFYDGKRPVPRATSDRLHAFDVRDDKAVVDIWKKRATAKSRAADSTVDPNANALRRQRLVSGLKSLAATAAMSQDKDKAVPRETGTASNTKLGDEQDAAARDSRLTNIRDRLRALASGNPNNISTGLNPTSQASLDNQSRHSEFLRSHPPSTATIQDATSPEPTAQHEQSGSLTPAGQKQAQKAAAALSPPTAFPSTHQKSLADHEADRQRWASYGELPGSFVQPAVSEATKGKAPEVPETPADTTEKPLLALFEAELAKMMKPEADQPSSTASTATQTPAELLQSPPVVSPGGSSMPFTIDPPSTQQLESTPPFGAINAGEIVGSTMKTLFEGVGHLASAALLHNPELHEQFSNAHQQFPGQLDHALRASARAIESLRGILPVPEPEPLRTLIELQDSENVEVAPQRELRSTDSANSQPLGLVWNVGGDASLPLNHTTQCLEGCVDTTCPVRRAVRNAYEQLFIFQGERTERSTIALFPPRIDSRFRPLSSGNYEADRIVGRRYVVYDDMYGPRKKQYLVRWVGHGEDDDIWYDAENLDGCIGLVSQYEERNPEKEMRYLFSPYTPVGQVQMQKINELHSRTAGDRSITFTKDADVRAKHPNAQQLQPIPSVNGSEDNDTKPLEFRPPMPMLDELESSRPDPFDGLQPETPAIVETETSVAEAVDLANAAAVDDAIKAATEAQATAAAANQVIEEGTELLHRSRSAKERRAASKDDRHDEPESRHERRRLRERRSWHPDTCKSTSQSRTQFEFEPAAVMEKYPPLSHLERDMFPISVARPNRPERQDSVRSQPAKDGERSRRESYKSVRFDESSKDGRSDSSRHAASKNDGDPWLQKRSAPDAWKDYKPREEKTHRREAWEETMRREESLYGPPSPTSTKRPARASGRDFFGEPEREIRRAKSLNFGSERSRRGMDPERKPEMTETRRLRYTPSLDILAGADRRSGPGQTDYRGYGRPSSSKVGSGIGESTRSRSPLGRNFRVEPEPGPEGAAKSDSGSRPVFDGAIKVPTRARAGPVAPHEHARPFEAYDETKAIAQQNLKTFAKYKAETAEREGNIRHCVKRLVEMGYGDDEARTVAQIVEGDLESAIDTLDEDERASKERPRGGPRQDGWSGGAWGGDLLPPMPGGFNWGSL